MLRSVGLALAVSGLLGLATDDIEVFIGCLCLCTAAWLFSWCMDTLRERLVGKRLKEFKPYQLKLLAASLQKEDRVKLRPMDEKKPHAFRLGRGSR